MKVLTRGPVVRVLPVIKAMFSPEATEENEDVEMISLDSLFFVIIIVGNSIQQTTCLLKPAVVY